MKPTILINGVERALNTVTQPLMASRLPFLADVHPVLPTTSWRDCDIEESYTLQRKDQGASNSCVGHALSSAGEACWQQDGNPAVIFNPWFSYDLISPNDNGASISDGLNSAQQIGLYPDDSKFPHRFMNALALKQMYGPLWTAAAGWKAEFAYHTPTWDEIMTAAQLRLPTLVGIAVGKAWERPSASGLCPLVGSDFLGWHCVLITGAQFDKDINEWTAWFLNSWSAQWGVKGKGRLRAGHFRDPVDAGSLQSMVHSGQAVPLVPAI